MFPWTYMISPFVYSWALALHSLLPTAITSKIVFLTYSYSSYYFSYSFISIWKAQIICGEHCGVFCSVPQLILIINHALCYLLDVKIMKEEGSENVLFAIRSLYTFTHTWAQYSHISFMNKHNSHSSCKHIPFWHPYSLMLLTSHIHMLHKPLPISFKAMPYLVMAHWDHLPCFL